MARLERVFFKIGFALLAVWAATTLHGIVLSRAALAKFRANQATKASWVPEQRSMALASGVNFANWSIKRVQAYKESLLGKVKFVKSSSTVQIAAFLLAFRAMAERGGLKPPLVRGR